ncbi:MAG: type II toxin-antitoxin system HicB family antitoxin [Patescibacteria group bacterium]
MLTLKLLKFFRPADFAFERQKFVNRIPRKYSVECSQDKDGVFYARVNEFENVLAFGDSQEEALNMVYDALLTYLAIPREVAVDLKPEFDYAKKEIKTRDCFKLATA